MSKGRKPKTDEQLKDQGTYRKDRHGTRAFIEKPLTDQPAEWLTPEEKAIWTKWYGLLQKNDILKETDEVAFGLMCKKLHRSQMFSKRLREPEDYIYVHESDVGASVKKKDPMYEIMVSEERDLMRILTEFGLTPASRGKIKTAVEQGEDPFEAAMKSA